MLNTIEVSTDLLLVSVEAMSKEDVRGPTLLPDWSRGHLLTHIARSADSLGRLVEWARTGIEQKQYASEEARAAQIQAGARRSPAELAADIRQSAVAFEQAARSLPESARYFELRLRSGVPVTAERLLFVRLRELEVHHVDLDVGYTWADIPPDVTTAVIDDIVATLSKRGDVPGVRLVATDVELERQIGLRGPVLTGEQADLLAWLSGRSPGAGLTVTGADEVPPAPHWI
ncbi:MAG: maleylpyruvate isomerase family mycothiol-dependent enzyme [Actinomycetota bacterium]|nr:maleylpyruvate isomerase family mycothiol-dependent enzyme [Actinomycetota bacterium]